MLIHSNKGHCFRCHQSFEKGLYEHFEICNEKPATSCTSKCGKYYKLEANNMENLKQTRENLETMITYALSGYDDEEVKRIANLFESILAEERKRIVEKIHAKGGNRYPEKSEDWNNGFRAGLSAAQSSINGDDEKAYLLA